MLSAYIYLNNSSLFTSTCGLCMCCHEVLDQVLGVEEPNGATIHRIENVTERGLHGLFDTLGIWFEATVRCIHLNPRSWYISKRLINIMCAEKYTGDPISNLSPNESPPDPWYLALHAAYADISGAGTLGHHFGRHGDDANGEGTFIRTSSCRTLGSVKFCRL